MPANKLSEWMARYDKSDDDVARALRGITRVQISRIRRGTSYASIKTAMRLQQLTRIPWKHFVRTPRIGRRARG